MTVEHDMQGDEVAISPTISQPRDSVGPTGTDMEDNAMDCEEVGDVISGGKREEEDRIEGHHVRPRSPPLQFCEDRA